MGMLDPCNRIIMNEIGLTVDDKYRVVDMDTGIPLTIDGKPLKYSAFHCVPVRHGEQIFDPMHKYKQMNVLFDYFIAKAAEENPSNTVDIYYEVGDTGALEAKGPFGTYTTDAYNQDQLKYVDMMLQVNGTPNKNLRQYDFDEKPDRMANKRKTKLLFD